MFGNEPDIFRYARRTKSHNLMPLGVGYGLGLLVFPVAGYLMAELSHATTLGQTMHFFIKFSLFGLTALGVIVFSVSVFALNDANLYEGVNAVQNVLKGRRRAESVIALGIVGAVVAIFMERSDLLAEQLLHCRRYLRRVPALRHHRHGPRRFPVGTFVGQPAPER